MARRQVQQVGGLVSRMEWRVRPDSEAGILTQASRSRLEGNARLIGNGGSATYSFRILGGMDIALRLTISGEGQVRVRTQAGGLLARAFRGGIQQLNLTTRAPLNPPVQTLQVMVETKRRTQARVYELQLVASDRDEDRDGIGDGVERLLGAPANALRPTIPATPRSGYQTGADYSPRLDLATDAVILHSFDPARLANWKARGYPVILMGGFRDYQPYAEANPDAVQRTRDGAPMSAESSFYLTPTPERIEALIRQYLQMLDAGADAVCPEEPEYWADAGYEAAFRQLYAARLGRPWQPPDASHAARWTADRFKAQLMTEAVHAILNAARARKPNAKRMVALHSPLNYALWRICLAHYALIFGDGFPDLPPSFRFPPLREGNQADAGAGAVPPAGRGNLKEGVIEEVIGQVWSDTVRTPLPSDGEYQAEPFATAYLEYASLAGLLRDTGKRLWFLCDPLSDTPNRPLEEHRQVYFNTLVASLMFPEATGYEVLPWPERIFWNVPAEYATVILSATRACEAIAQQSGATIDAGVEGIGLLFSDSMTAVRGAPEIAPVEDMLALGVPLVNAGIPLTMHSMQRLPERALPRSLRLLLWTPETVKPLREAEMRALAEWVQSGGWLFVVGGANGYDAIPDMPWQQAGQPTPVHWLLQMLGKPLTLETVLPEPAPPEAWRTLGVHGTEPAQGVFNRRWVDIDLSDYRGQTVFVRFSDSIPDTGWGALLRQARLEADGRTLAAFFTGSPAEPLFLHTNHRSRLNANGERFADRDAFFVYRFPLPQARAITLRLELAQEWRLDISTQPPYREHLVAPTRTDLPAIRLRDDEVITRYQTPDAEPFYTYDGAPVGVSLRAGRGGIVLLGVSGRAFGNAYGGARDWRATVRHVCGLAGVRYRERARIVARRGEWVAAYGTYRTTTLRGTYLDALDPRLPILTDPPLNPRMPRLLLQVDNRLRSAGLLHTNAQVLLRHEAGGQLAYLVRGPEGINGVARFSLRGLQGRASLTDTLGNPLPHNAEREGGTLLVRWNLSPDGQVLTIR
ncbi:hypothetical protein [Synechococcus sp. RC10A2]|uniref:hypothetical protein n=1 Tax=Synechococcus sp. RC10A2 TaxID=2964529 RepID=UPI0039C7263E